MIITIVTFAQLADQLGWKRIELEMPDNITVAQAIDELTHREPAMATTRDRLATAVNLAYVAPDHYLEPGDELALIPPVSGG